MLRLQCLPRSVCPLRSRNSLHHMLYTPSVPSLVSSTPHPLYSLSVHPCPVYGSSLRPSCGLHFSNRLFLLFSTWVIGLILRNVMHSLLVVTPCRNAYHRYADSVPKTRAPCLRTAW